MGMGRVELPDGCYGVPDPHDGRRLTFWVVRSRRLKVWPPDVRYAPFPPSGMNSVEREDWYQQVYYPWKRAVVADIAADPGGASVVFRQEAPRAAEVPADYGARRRVRRLRLDGPAGGSRRVTERQLRLAGQRDRAVALRKAGSSYTEIATELAVSKTTAHRYVQAASGGPAHRALLLMRADELGRSLAAARLWSGDPLQQERIAVLLAEVERLRGVIRGEEL